MLAITLSALISLAPAATAPDAAKPHLREMLECSVKKPSPTDVVAAIKTLGGKAIVANSGGTAAAGEYTLPTAIDVFGRPATHLSIQEDVRDSGRAAITYVSVLQSSALDEVARTAGVAKNEAGDYRKTNDKRRTIWLVRSGTDVLVQCVVD